METTNQDIDPPIEPGADPTSDPAAGPGGDDGGTASDLYDADRPPFGELPEKPKRPPAPAGAPAGEAPWEADPARSRQKQLGAAAVVAALLILFLLRRRRRRHGLVRGRGRRS